MYWIGLISVVVPMILSACGALLVRGWAQRRGLLDRPADHKTHRRAVPLGGGIAITASVVAAIVGGLAVALLVGRWRPEWLPALVAVHLEGVAAKTPVALAVLAGAVVLCVTGLVDDMRPLPAAVKLIIEAAVAAALVIGLKIRALEMFGPAVAIVVTTFWIVGVTNAMNFLDNTDGLCAGVGIIAGVIFAIAAMLGGQIFVPVFTLALVGALAGFLVLNFPPASIFMGDAGSLVVGYLLAVLTVLTTFHDPAHGHTPLGVLVPLVVLAVPLYDVASVVWLRIRAGDSPFVGDRQHFSHRLIQRGMSQRSAVLTIYLATAATGMSALWLPSSDWPRAALVVAQCACIVLIVAVLERQPSHGSR